ncbi:MAG: hypothetical protein HRU17_10970 [Polyangiaceae bacterium]|nr:hypothetical protein [Polyangiaceae bacterium]
MFLSSSASWRAATSWPAVTFCLLFLFACSPATEQEPSIVATPNGNTGTDGTTGTGGAGGSGDNGGSGGALIFNGPTGPADCTPKTCADFASADFGSCGVILTGCDLDGDPENAIDQVQCGDCGTGESCSLEVGNLCAPTPIDCVPWNQIAACDGRCGPVGDNCGSIYQCGEECGPSTVCSNFPVVGVCTDKCIPVSDSITCEGKCGDVLNNCDEKVACGNVCQPGFACGLLVASECGQIESDCTQLFYDDLCPGKCGDFNDGCGGKVVCDMCPDGFGCGGYGDTGVVNECGETPTGDDENCPAKINSCAEVAKDCGIISNGCGGTIDCDAESGGCGNAEICGTITPSVCDIPPACEPLSAAAACAGTCGIVTNGCSSTIDCATQGFPCPDGESCGGGGSPGVCGAGDPSNCTPFTAATLCPGKCGIFADGCGSTVDCSSNANNGPCTNDEWCGGGSVANECGKPACVTTSPAEACAGDKCGQVSDGCDGLMDCGGCDPGDICGLTATNSCGTPQCQAIPVDAACAGKCASVSDGCGASYTCNNGNGGVTCQEPAYCGGGGVANNCGQPSCTTQTCAQQGYTCGIAPDNCGGFVDCWDETGNTARTCSQSNATCMGTPSTCVSSGGGGGNCTGPLCDNISACSDSAPTKITGRVTTPDGEVGIPNALVYIPQDPSATLPAITQGPSCDRCEDEDLGPVLVSALTGYDGYFSLDLNVPTGTDFKLVVKIGKWRRAITVGSTVLNECQTNAIGETYTRLPRNQNDGLAGTQIPKIAISTGRRDEMECVFEKIGIDDDEFTAPNVAAGQKDGRIHLYRSNGARIRTRVYACEGGGLFGSDDCDDADHDNEAACEADSDCDWEYNEEDGSVADTTLFSDQATLNNYDMVVFDCEGTAWTEHKPHDEKVRDYAEAGGRIFASHFSFGWLFNTARFSASAEWDTDTDYPDNGTGLVSVGRPMANDIKVANFRDWLNYEDALTGTNPPRFAITDPRDNALQVLAGSEEWVYRETGTDTTSVQQFSFNTPLGETSENICGRVAYSAFHVAGADNDSSGDYFPGVCNGDTLTSQEKVLVYMLFDLAACVSEGEPPQPPSCTPQTSDDLCVSDACGIFSDGCGDIIDCGDSCPGDQYCSSNICTDRECTVATCGSLGANCGIVPDGCGGSDDCGICAEGQVCGYEQPNICGQPLCTPDTYDDVCVIGSCGTVSDGCGGVIDCGSCSLPEVCGGGGTANMCGEGSCDPRSCEDQGYGCGMAGDGCGNTIECAACNLPETCGGGGTPNECGQPSCPPQSCNDVGAECGFIGDGCGGAVDCGVCPNNGVCGGAGPNLCGGACVTVGCDDVGADCGAIGDGCGGIVDCGPCTNGQICGWQTANICDAPPTCSTTTCQAESAECGFIGDGCGASVDCGPCTEPGESCGGAGVPNQCGIGTSECEVTTCGAEGAQCGLIGDGCSATINCGDCPNNETCGALSPNQCAGCTPLDCAGAGAECDLIGDGCGSVIDCGPCTGTDETCGGAGTPNQCGVGDTGCYPATCEELNVDCNTGGSCAECGAVADGCGGLLQCGTCPEGDACGAQGTPNKCQGIPT